MNKSFISKRGIVAPVKTLDNEVARKIAAGEVIDRPNAVVRELLDNAIDAGSYSISVEIDGGGIERIRITDDGIGLSKEDLEHCATPHATSKITSEVDLLNLSTLGFRGEALASIASVSRLDITSRRITTDKKTVHAWHLHAEVGYEYNLEPVMFEKGTAVESRGLFENFPARRLFLKRASTEGNLCKQIFLEKTIPFPEIEFRLLMDGTSKIFLPSTKSKKERFAYAIGMEKVLPLFYELHAQENSSAPQWNITLVIGDSSITRADKKYMYIYVNNRKITEYSFIQAIEYGCEGYYPNALHPVCCLFVEINPALVDFNIHPAKKEARFKDSSAIHHAISSTVRSFFRSQAVSSLASPKYNSNNDEQDFYSKEKTFSPQNHREPKRFSYSSEGFYHKKPLLDQNETYSAGIHSPNTISNIKQDSYEYENKESNQEHSDFTYFGSYEGLFLLAEKDGLLYIIDQHAGHERILFNSFMEKIGNKQQLLIPLKIVTSSSDEDKYIDSISKSLDKAGFSISNKKPGLWEINSIGSMWQGTEKDLQTDLLEKRVEPQDLIRTIAAKTACRSAVKDGDTLDSNTATSLIKEIFALPDPHCPHGRPIWTIITKKELFERVKRT